MSYQDLELSSPTEIVNAFGAYFSSVFISSDPSIDNSHNFTGKDIPNALVSISDITEEEILLALKRSKQSLTSGTDLIPSFILKDCAYVLVKPLHYLFNLILRTSSFPEKWKKATVTPIFKKGDPSMIQNYRPICLLCNFVKIFESILYVRIYSSIKSYLTTFQHGFLEKNQLSLT